jgi:O-acetyl-ADP-ribose deacetylase (regulator of RNase III)
MLYEIRGDLISLAKKGVFDVIVHGCNCMHTMDGGIAREVAKSFPSAGTKDAMTVYGDKNKLGTFSYAVDGVDQRLLCDFDERRLVEYKSDYDKTLFVVNAYTQYKPGRDLYPWALAAALARVTAEFSGKVFGMPLIGCGIAGGDWEELKKIIDIIFHDERLIVVHYDK